MRNFILFLLILVITLNIAVGGENSAHITLSKSIDVPDKTVFFENRAFEITEIGNYKTNQEINFTVDAPGADDMLIVLYDRDKLSTWYERFSNTGGHAVVVIPSNKTDKAGMYAVTISHNRTMIGAVPVVISDYDMAVNPGSKQIISGNTLDVEVRISKNGIPINVNNTVKVVLAKGSSSFETNATAVKTGVYEAHLKIPLAANGTFSLYSVITTERKVFIKYPETIGIERGGYIEIQPPGERLPEERAPFVGLAAALAALLCAALLRRKL